VCARTYRQSSVNETRRRCWRSLNHEAVGSRLSASAWSPVWLDGAKTPGAGCSRPSVHSRRDAFDTGGLPSRVAAEVAMDEVDASLTAPGVFARRAKTGDQADADNRDPTAHDSGSASNGARVRLTEDCL